MDIDRCLEHCTTGVNIETWVSEQISSTCKHVIWSYTFSPAFAVLIQILHLFNNFFHIEDWMVPVNGTTSGLLQGKFLQFFFNLWHSFFSPHTIVKALRQFFNKHLLFQQALFVPYSCHPFKSLWQELYMSLASKLAQVFTFLLYKKTWIRAYCPDLSITFLRRLHAPSLGF